jgi:hypothetical protein
MAHISSEEIEFGFPSTHAMMGAAVGTYIAHYFLTHIGHANNIFLIVWWFIFVFLWSISISLSRVYLGAHSFQDIAGGWLIGMIYGQLWTVVGDFIDSNLPDSYFTYFIISVSVVWIIFVFHPVDKSSWIRFHLSEGCFDNSASLLGVALTGIVWPPFIPGDSMCIGVSWNLLFRWVIGLTMLISVYFGCSKILPLIFAPLLKVLGVTANNLGYKQFKIYIVQSIEYYGDVKSNNLEASSKPNGNGTHAINGNGNGSGNGHHVNNGNGVHLNNNINNNNNKNNSNQTSNGNNHNISGNGHHHDVIADSFTKDVNPKNPEKRLAWVRYLTKIFQYFIFSSCIGFTAPMLFLYIGI